MPVTETRDSLNRDVFPRQDQDRTASAEVLTGGSITEALCGVAAIVLAIIGLAGMYPVTLAAIATIVLGAAFIVEGGAVMTRFSRLVSNTQTTASYTELGGGMTSQVLGGLACVVLGILALFNIFPLVLMAVAAIVFGAALMISSGSTARLNHLTIEGWVHMRDSARGLAREAVSGAAGAQVLTGLAAIVLGILALIGLVPLVLVLVSLLCVGAAGLLTGSAVSGRMMSMLFR